MDQLALENLFYSSQNRLRVLEGIYSVNGNWNEMERKKAQVLKQELDEGVSLLKSSQPNCTEGLAPSSQKDSIPVIQHMHEMLNILGHALSMSKANS